MFVVRNMIQVIQLHAIIMFLLVPLKAVHQVHQKVEHMVLMLHIPVQIVVGNHVLGHVNVPVFVLLKAVHQVHQKVEHMVLMLHIPVVIAVGNHILGRVSVLVPVLLRVVQVGH